MTGQNPLKKHYPAAKCEHCGQATNISYSHDYNHLLAQNKTLNERIKFESLVSARVHRAKNSQKQMFSKMIGQMLKIMTPEQIIQMKSHSQELRDRLREAEKEMFK